MGGKGLKRYDAMKLTSPKEIALQNILLTMCMTNSPYLFFACFVS